MQSPRRRAAIQHSRPRKPAASALITAAALKATIERLESRRLLSAITVNTPLDQTDMTASPTVSLRDALNLASSASTPTTITFDPTVFATQQTISLTSAGALLLSASADVTVTGPAAGLIISANGRSNDLIEQSAPAASVNISNITFTDGQSNYGGGIEHTGTDTLTLTNVTVSNNTAYYDGGGIYNAGTLIIDSSTIANNAATNVAGGDGPAAFGAGGGIDNAGGILTLKNSTVSGNTSQSINAIGGGGISNIRSGTVTLLDSTISGNSTYANQPGGTLVNAPGGGLLSTGPLTITNSTISGNTGSLGGGLYITDGVTLSNSTISANTATRGGGLYLTTDDTLQNTVVSGNSTFPNGQGPDVFTRATDSVLSNGFNLIGQSDGSTGWNPSDNVGTTANPVDAKLAPLANNGGPTQTMLPLPGSPLIDAGSNALIPAGVTTDQRGQQRIFNTTVDIGAVETQSSISVNAPSTQSAVVGQSQSFNLGSFTASEAAAPFTITVNWGDNSAPTTFTQSAPGTLAQLPHTFTAAGTHTVTLTVTDASNALSASNTFVVNVGGESITLTPPPDQTAFVGISQSFSLGSFTESNAPAPYAIAVNWGDNSADTTFSAVAAGSIVSQSHTFTAHGTSTVTINIADASGNITSGAAFTVNVMLGSIAITPPDPQNAGLNQTKAIQLGTLTASNVNTPYGIDITWGDGSADTLLTTNQTGALPPQLHLFSRLGPDTVTVTVTDASGLVRASANFLVTVTSAGISVAPPANQSALVGEPTTLSLGSFTETDAAAPYAIDINWGDNSPHLALTASAPGDVPAEEHTFASLGSDLVTVTVTDASGVVSGSASFTVNVIDGSTPSSTALAVSSNSFPFAQSQTLTATVSPLNATGTVTFLQNGVSLGIAPLIAGVATLSSSDFASGNDSLTAVYSGDGTYASSTSPAVPVTVAPPANTTGLSLSAATSSITAAQSLTLTATLTPPNADGIAATGSVTFYQGSTVLGVAPVQAGGRVTFTTTAPLPVGNNTLTARYTGDANFAPSQAQPITITVAQAQTRAALTLSTHSKTPSQQLTCQATLTLLSPTPFTGLAPDGIVTFNVNGTPFGTAVLSPAGIATLITTAALPNGQNSITATYSGSASFATSISAAQNLFVTPQALVPAINRAVVPASAIAGQRTRGAIIATLTNQVTNASNGIEKGIFSARLFASASTTLSPSSDTVIATVVHNAKIPHGRSVRVTVPITTFPATLAAGVYHLILETTDAAGNTQWIDTGKTVNVLAPVVSLSAAFVSVPANFQNKGAIVSLLNTGNISDLSKFNVTLSLATDAAGTNKIATLTGKLLPPALLLRPNKPVKLRVTGWKALFAQVPPANYFLTITLSDTAQHTATAVSATPNQ
jgi:hypothetical protein